MSTHQHNPSVDLAAPGYDVAISAAPGWYLTSTGTSFAAPLVSGTVALMLAVNPCLSNLDIEYILKNSSVNIDALNPTYAGKIGSGRLDAEAAVMMASNFVTTPIHANAIVTGSCMANSASILINPTGGQVPYSILWSNNYNGISQDSLALGTYSINIADARGCILDTSINVATSAPAVIVANQTNVTCFGLGNGAIDVSVLQGVPTYSYAWDNGATTEDLSNLSPGTYRLTLTDGNGCITFVSYSISEPSEIALTVETSLTTGNDGTIDLSVAGGTPTYTYLWSNNETTEDLTNLSAGVYDVTVTDANGCQAIIQAEVIAESTSSLNGKEDNTWMMYPNPTSNNATITWNLNDDISELIITDSNGKLTSRKSVKNETTYEVENLESGIYYVTLYKLNTKVGSQKLVVL